MVRNFPQAFSLHVKNMEIKVRMYGDISSSIRDAFGASVEAFPVPWNMKNRAFHVYLPSAMECISSTNTTQFID